MAKKTLTIYIDNTRLRITETRGKRVKKLGELHLDLGQSKVNASIKEAEVIAKIKQSSNPKR